jgi:hypothetical protein
VSSTRLIPPGQEGRIEVKLSTRGYGGRKVSETVRIQTDDPAEPSIQVRITGQVEKFADIRPERVFLGGAQGKPLSAEVVITPSKQYPFTIKSIEARDGSFIRYEIKEGCKDSNSRCVIKVENTRTEKGRFGDILFIRTDSPLRPEMPIRIEGRID